MHIYFSGIGGSAIGPLAMIAKEAGYTVSGSDKQSSSYIDYLKAHGVSNIHIGQSKEQITKAHATQPIDWYVYSSAVMIENPDAPELTFCREHNIHMSKRDELLNKILEDKNIPMLAIAGTHGKTTTTAMMIWTMKQLKIPISYSVGAKIPFGDMGEFHADSEYFVYECDEFDRNFLAFSPELSIITGIDWDHPDIYPTREDYNKAFITFLGQTKRAVMWQDDVTRIGYKVKASTIVLAHDDPAIHHRLTLTGKVNREDAWQVANTIAALGTHTLNEALEAVSSFPGVSRRFEKIVDGLYSDYAHTPSKIAGALQIADETRPGKVVVIYEGIHNTRQHFIRKELTHLFDKVQKLVVVPTYLAREDSSLELLTPKLLIEGMSSATRAHAVPATLGSGLKAAIKQELDEGYIVVCLSAGGGSGLDEWIRAEFA